MLQFSHSLTFLNADETPVFSVSVARAARLPQRMRGLLFHPVLPEGCGLLIERCPSVHTFGMRYAIDVVFFDRERRVVRVCAGVPKNRVFVSGGFRAASVLEVRSGWLPLGSLRDGMRAVLNRTLPS